MRWDRMADPDDIRTERPAPDASNAEWAEWMGEDFTAAVTEALEEVAEAGGVGSEVAGSSDDGSE